MVELIFLYLISGLTVLLLQVVLGKPEMLSTQGFSNSTTVSIWKAGVDVVNNLLVIFTLCRPDLN